MVPVQHTLRLDHDGWPPYDHRRGGDNHTGGRCTTTGAGATTTGRGAETTATGTGSSKPMQTCTFPACADHGTASTSRHRPRRVKILPFRSTVFLCCITISSSVVHGLIHDCFYEGIEQRSCHALCPSQSGLQCVAGAFAPSLPARAGWDRNSRGRRGTTGLCRHTATLRCRKMPTLPQSAVRSFRVVKEGVSRLLYMMSRRTVSHQIAGVQSTT
jgi:hypothetical protein